MSSDIDRFWISRGVTERLHYHICGEAQASQVFQFIASHRTGSILRADRRHARFAVSARTHALPFGQTASAANHFLSQCETSFAFSRCLRQTEFGRSRQFQGFACFGGQAATDNQVDTATGLHFVQQYLGFQAELGNGFAVFHDFAFIRQDIDDIAHFQSRYIDFNRQCAGVFLSIEENRSNFATQAYAAETFVRYERNIFACMPNYRVGSRFA